jgi:hypothetical protein
MHLQINNHAHILKPRSDNIRIAAIPQISYFSAPSLAPLAFFSHYAAYCILVLTFM